MVDEDSASCPRDFSGILIPHFSYETSVVPSIYYYTIIFLISYQNLKFCIITTLVRSIICSHNLMLCSPKCDLEFTLVEHRWGTWILVLSCQVSNTTNLCLNSNISEEESSKGSQSTRSLDEKSWCCDSVCSVGGVHSSLSTIREGSIWSVTSGNVNACALFCSGEWTCLPRPLESFPSAQPCRP